jgi:hypothetical protein
MITNIGKNLLAKYLVGQTQSYASHIAVGCGAKPVASDGGNFGDYSLKNSLDFEMFRVPIISRGFVNENGIDKIVLTAELPTEERYEITEVGVFSAASNPVAGSFDSKSIYSFTDTDNWLYQPVGSAAIEIPVIYEPLDDRVVNIVNATASGTTITYTTDVSHGLTVGTKISVSGIAPVVFNLVDKNIQAVPTPNTFTLVATSPISLAFVSSGILINDVETNIISQAYPVFQTNADNKIFTNSSRVARNERCRFLNNIIAMVGNSSTLTKNSLGKLEVGSQSKYIRLNETSVDFTKNSPLDELRFAFSVVNKVGNANTVPDNVKILIDFSHAGTTPEVVEYARFEVDIDDIGYSAGTAAQETNFDLNRYIVTTKALKDLNKTDNFDWREVSVAKIYACVTEAGAPSDLFYVCLDGLRLENITSTNSLYGLTGYSVIKSVGAKPIIKSANTTNYIEFRFALGV